MLASNVQGLCVVEVARGVINVLYEEWLMV